MQEFKNTYFKHTKVMVQISGLPLPITYMNDKQETVSNCRFEDCDFHPCCSSVHFVCCEFINCNGIEYLHLYRCDSRPK